MQLVWKLLRQHVSRSQLAGFFLANLIGTGIILLSIQFYADLQPVLSGKGDSFLKKEFLTITKKVSTLSSLSGKNNTFTPAEIDELKQQAFIRNVGNFTPSQFDVVTGISLEKLGVHLSTEMFFESVPDDYIDADLSGWHFNEADRIIPIILPRNYLHLYNFGFAQSRNLPKISEGMAEAIRLDIQLRGDSESERFTGKIAGFSDRLNTILVPEKFMDWANTRFAGGKSPAPSRLIAEIANPTDRDMTAFFLSKGYETESGRLDAGKTAWFLNLAVSLVAGIGLLICLLALYILTLSIFLLLQKNNEKLRTLLLLGYSSSQVSRPYMWLTITLNACVLLFSIFIVIALRGFYIQVIAQLWPGFQQSNLLPAIITGFILFIVISGINTLIIRQKIRSIGKN